MNGDQQAALSNSSLHFKTVRPQWSFSSYCIKSLNLQYIFRIKYSVFFLFCITTMYIKMSFSKTIQWGNSTEWSVLPGLWGGVFTRVNRRLPLTLLYRFLKAKFTFVMGGQPCDPCPGGESDDCGRVQNCSQWHCDMWAQRNYCHQGLERSGAGDVCHPLWWPPDSYNQQESLCGPCASW